MEFDILSRETVFKGRLIHLENVRTRMPDKKEALFEVVRHPGAVAMLPVDDERNIWFVRQFRVPVERVMLEIPAGTLEDGEAPNTCAYRELREEIGMAPGMLLKLASIILAPGYSSEILHIFLATGLQDDPLTHDADEFLNVQKIPVEEAYAMAKRGEITDSKSLSALLLAQPYLVG